MNSQLNSTLNLSRLPIELRWRICNEVLFDQPTIPNLNNLFQLPSIQPNYNQILRKVQHQAILSQNKFSFERLKIHEIVLKSIKDRNGEKLKELMEKYDDQLNFLILQQTRNSLNHSLSQSAFFVEGSSQYLLNGILFLEKCSKKESLKRDEKQNKLLKRMIEYCIKEEERELISESSISLIFNSLFGSLNQQLIHILNLEQYARQNSFEWENTERLQEYLIILNNRSKFYRWTHFLLFQIPLLFILFIIWINSKETFDFGFNLKLLISFLLIMFGRETLVILQKHIIISSYNLARSNENNHHTLIGWLFNRFLQKVQSRLPLFKCDRKRNGESVIVNQIKTQKEIFLPNHFIDARKPINTKWINEVLIRNASHKHIIVETFNAADHFLMISPFMRTTIKPRDVILVKSAWDLRGTRIMIKIQSLEKDDKIVYWNKGSKFNLQRKNCLLIPKSGNLTVTDEDFIV